MRFFKRNEVPRIRVSTVYHAVQKYHLILSYRRCLQYETFVERKFSCATVEDRDNWVQVLQVPYFEIIQKYIKSYQKSLPEG